MTFWRGERLVTRRPGATGAGLRRSPSVQNLPRLLGMVSVGEVRQALLEFAIALQAWRGHGIVTSALDGTTLRGAWEEGKQLKTLCVFSHAGLAALDQVAIGTHLEEPRAAQAWMETVAASCPGLEMLTGDARYADTALAQATVDRGKDYTFKLKKPAPAPRRRILALRRGDGATGWEVTGKGHGRIEHRQVWVSGELAG